MNKVVTIPKIYPLNLLPGVPTIDMSFDYVKSLTDIYINIIDFSKSEIELVTRDNEILIYGLISNNTELKISDNPNDYAIIKVYMPQAFQGYFLCVFAKNMNGQDGAVLVGVNGISNLEPPFNFEGTSTYNFIENITNSTKRNILINTNSNQGNGTPQISYNDYILLALAGLILWFIFKD